MWSDKDVYFFDLDGTLYFRDELAPGAGELLEKLRSIGKKIGFITNNSRETADEIAQKLGAMGISAAPNEILCGTDAAGQYVLDHYGVKTVKAVGSESLERAIAGFGHRVLPLFSPERADVIVLGRDTGFTFDKLQKIAIEEGKGTRLLATNSDRFHPGPGGIRIPETGALAQAVEAVTGKPIPSIGKPETFMLQLGMRRYGADAHCCVMVGDNLDTDIAGGVRAGMSTVWIQSGGMGQTLEGRDSSAPMPDLTISRLEQLIQLIT